MWNGNLKILGWKTLTRKTPVGWPFFVKQTAAEAECKKVVSSLVSGILFARFPTVEHVPTI